MDDIYFRVIEFCEDSYIKAPKTRSESLESIARACAEHYHSNYDGHECWASNNNLTFMLHEGENGKVLAVFSIYIEYTPDFYCREVGNDKN